MIFNLKKYLIAPLLLLCMYCTGQVTYEKTDQGSVFTVGVGTPTSNSVTPTTGDVYKNSSTGEVYTAINGSWALTGTTEVNPWSAYATMTITAVTTPPTKATTTQWDSVRYRVYSEAVGSTPQRVEVDYIYSATSATGTAGGSGNYLFQLPNGYQFDTGEHAFYTGTTDLSNGSLAIYAIDRGQPKGIIEGDVFYDFAIIVPYDATHFRVMVMGGNAPDEWIGSGWYPITQADKVMAFTFIFYSQ
jgi:hypothetical protein